MMFNTTFNNISVLLVEETGVHTEKTIDLPQTLSHNVISSTPNIMSGIQTHNISGDRH
jgi:hypothetical protein